MRKNGAVTSYIFDVSDDRRLVGFADDVFVGRVLRKVGEEGLPTSDPDHRIAQIQFAVEVAENIKGELAGTVTVNQLGGHQEYVAEGNHPELEIRAGNRVRELVLFDGDPLLEPGREYLLVTKRSRRKGWHEIAAPGFGDVPLGDDGEGAVRIVDRFRQAVEHQIDPFDHDGAGPPGYKEAADRSEVVLSWAGLRKVRVIREVMAAMGLGAMEAKALVDSVPIVIAKDLPGEEARALAARMQAAGAAVELRR